MRCAGLLLVLAAGTAVAALEDLPLVERPASGAGDAFVVLLTGDGGWAAIDRGAADAFVAAGTPVVGLDCLRYFWHRRAPEEASSALADVIEHYAAAWQRPRVILLGYSFGADVLPFLATRLPRATLSRVALVALVGPSPEADFEIHVTDWIRDAPPPSALPLLPELRALRARGPRLLCIFGTDEPRSLCPTLPPGLASIDVRPGAHHLDRDYAAVARRVLAALDAPPR